MNARILLAPIAFAGLLGPSSQEASNHEKPLTRVFPASESAETWARELRAPDLATRREAYGELLAEAAQSPALRETLRGWALGDDLELAWTAELLLREVDAALDARGGSGRGPSHRHGLRFQSPEDLFREFGSMFEDPFAGVLRSPDPRDPRLLGPFGAQALGGPWSHSTSQGLSLRTGPEGVRVEVREMEDGDEKISSYEAESLEALLEEHPELEERLNPDALGDDGSGVRSLLRMPFAERGAPPVLLRPREIRTDMLGVQIRLPEARTRSIEGLDDGLGLEVVAVVRGGLAQVMGVLPGEILVGLNGRELRSVEDVKRALAERLEEETLELDVIRADGVEVTRSWRPTVSGQVF